MAIVAYKITPLKKGRKKEHVVFFESSGPGNVPRNASSQVVQKMTGALKEFAGQMEPVRAVVEGIREALDDANRPNKIEVEFGIEMGISAEIPMITSGSAKANFKVKVTWENSPAR